MKALMEQLAAVAPPEWPTYRQYIRLLLDQGLPRSAAQQLRQHHIDTLHVGEIGLSRAEDQIILQEGRDQGRIVVTLDADFHALLALAHAKNPSVIRIRIEGLRAAGLVELISALLPHFFKDLLQGAAVTVTENGVRTRQLPLRQE